MNSIIKLSAKQREQSFPAGNSEILNELVTRHKDRIYNTIYILVKDKYMAEDISQDVIIRIINSLKSSNYIEEGKFLPWALRIANNMCIDHFRKVKRSPNITITSDSNIFEFINFSEPSIECLMIRTQGHEKVRRIIDRLPDDLREVVILRYYADLSFKEIAELTNCSINTALGRMRYGLLNMRKMMFNMPNGFYATPVNRKRFSKAVSITS